MKALELLKLKEERIKVFRRSLLFIVITYLSISAITIFFWFKDKAVLAFDDEWFPFNPPVNVQEYNYIWSKLNGGGISAGAANFHYSIWYLLLTRYLDIPLWLAQALTSFLLLFLAFWSSFILIKKLLEILGFDRKVSEVSSFIGSLFYVFNPYNMCETWVNFSTKMPIAYAFYPLFLYYLLNLTKARRVRIRDCVTIPLLLYLSLQGTPKIWAFEALCAIVLALALRMYTTPPSLKTNVQGRSTACIILSILIFILLSAPFFYPILLSSWSNAPAYLKPKNIDVYLRLLQLRSKESTILNVLRLWGMNIVFEPLNCKTKYMESLLRFYEAPTGIMVSTIPLILLSLSLIFVKKLREKEARLLYIILWLCVLGEISILAVMHISFMRSFFIKLYASIPYMEILNAPWEAAGFTYIIIISLLTGISLAIIRKYYKKLFGIMVVLILMYITFNALFFVPGTFFPSSGVFNAKVKVPTYVNDLVKYLNNIQEDGSVVLLPLVRGKLSYNWSYPFYGNNILAFMINKNVISRPTNPISSLISKVQNEASLFKYRLVQLDNNTKCIIIEKNLMNLHRDFRLCNIKIFIKENSVLKITFYGKPVGHVDYVLFFHNGTSKADYAFASKYTTYAFIVKVNANSLIEPRAWKDSNVTRVMVERIDLKNGATINLSSFYINALRLLGVRWIIIHDVVWKPFMSPDRPNLLFIENLIKPYTYARTFGRAKLFEIKEQYLLKKVYVPERVIVLSTWDSRELLNALSKFSPYEKPLLVSRSQALSLPFLSNYTLKNNVKVRVIENQQTRLRISINSNSNKGVIVVLLQNFDKLWKAYVIDEKGSRVRVPDSFHFVANGYANAWYINKSGKFIVELIYEPQEYYEILLQVSNVLFVIILASMLLCYIATPVVKLYRLLSSNTLRPISANYIKRPGDAVA